jgi:hypothetical protein
VRLVTRLIVAQAAESALVLFGVLRFMTARYVGGTLLAIITAAVLIPSRGRPGLRLRTSAGPGGPG